MFSLDSELHAWGKSEKIKAERNMVNSKQSQMDGQQFLTEISPDTRKKMFRKMDRRPKVAVCITEISSSELHETARSLKLPK